MAHAPYWWTKKQDIQRVGFDLESLRYKPNSPGAIAQARLAQLDAEIAEAQALFLERQAELERLKEIGTEPVIASWDTSPEAVLTITPTATEIDAYTKSVAAVLERRTDLDDFVNRKVIHLILED